MWSASNLRAENYVIENANFEKVKLIAGKIIPAIATATAMAVGIVGWEQIKVTMGKPIEKIRNSFSNLAINLYLFSETMPPIKNKDQDYDPIVMSAVKAIPTDWTSWDSLDIQGPCTLQQMLDKLKEGWGLIVDMMILGTKTIYMGGNKSFAAALEKNCEDLYMKAAGITEIPKGTRYVIFNASMSTDDGDEASTPVIRYMLS